MKILLGIVLSVWLASSASANSGGANCRIIEDRGNFLSFALMHGMAAPITAMTNPYFTAVNFGGADADHANQLLSDEISKAGYDGVAASAVPQKLLQSAQDNVGLQIANKDRLADLALIYGSSRTVHDGSIHVVYEMVDVRSGNRGAKILSVSKKELRRVLGVLCRDHGCTADALLADPTRASSAIKVVVGIELAHELESVCRK